MIFKLAGVLVVSANNPGSCARSYTGLRSCADKKVETCSKIYEGSRRRVLDVVDAYCLVPPPCSHGHTLQVHRSGEFLNVHDLRDQTSHQRMCYVAVPIIVRALVRKFGEVVCAVWACCRYASKAGLDSQRSTPSSWWNGLASSRALHGSFGVSAGSIWRPIFVSPRAPERLQQGLQCATMLQMPFAEAIDSDPQECCAGYVELGQESYGQSSGRMAAIHIDGGALALWQQAQGQLKTRQDTSMATPDCAVHLRLHANDLCCK